MQVRQDQSRLQGFTIIELVVGMLLSAMLVGSVLVVFGTLQQVYRNTEGHTGADNEFYPYPGNFDAKVNALALMVEFQRDIGAADTIFVLGGNWHVPDGSAVPSAIENYGPSDNSTQGFIDDPESIYPDLVQSDGALRRVDGHVPLSAALYIEGVMFPRWRRLDVTDAGYKRDVDDYDVLLFSGGFLRSVLRVYNFLSVVDGRSTPHWKVELYRETEDDEQDRFERVAHYRMALPPAETEQAAIAPWFGEDWPLGAHHTWLRWDDEWRAFEEGGAILVLPDPAVRWVGTAPAPPGGEADEAAVRDYDEALAAYNTRSRLVFAIPPN